MLTRMRSGVVRPLGIVVVWMVVLSSCQTGEHVVAPRVRYDGETLYRGIFQGRGPVADAIPEIRDNFRLDDLVSGEERDTVIETYDRIVATIAKIEPTFFDRFQSAIESGDHLIIQEQLEAAAAVTLHAVMSWPESKLRFREVSRNSELVNDMTAAINEKLDPNDRLQEDEVGQILQDLSASGVTPIQDDIGLCVMVPVVVAVFAWVFLVKEIGLLIEFVVFIYHYRWVKPHRYPASSAYGVSPLLAERMVDSIARDLHRVGEEQGRVSDR